MEKKLSEAKINMFVSNSTETLHLTNSQSLSLDVISPKIWKFCKFATVHFNNQGTFVVETALKLKKSHI